MEIGQLITSGSFVDTQNNKRTLEDLRGHWLVLYFYPKDATPGCTLESQTFRDKYVEFNALNAEILGVSRDSLKSHENFKCKQQLPFELICDTDEQLCLQFDVMKIKSMYGKQVRGIERSTFLIDPAGYLRHIWRKVKVPNHIDEVLAMLRQLSAQ